MVTKSTGSSRALKSAATYLADKNILSPGMVVEQGVRLTSASRGRAVSVRVEVGSEGGFLYKQGLPKTRKWVRREIQCYQIAASINTGQPIVPPLIHCDLENAVLVTELLTPSQTLHEYFVANALGPCEPLIGLAHALATLHCCSHNSNLVLPKPLPWVLSTKTSKGLQPSRIESDMWDLFGQCIEHQCIFQVLGNAHRTWRQECMIHGDAKWDNFLLTDRAEHGLWIIDWELGAMGDPAWDVATVVQECLLWNTLEWRGNGQSYESLTPQILRAVGSFLKTYLYQTDFVINPDAQYLRKISTFVVSRLIQTASELSMVEGGLGDQTQAALRMAQSIGENLPSFEQFMKQAQSAE